MATEKKQKMIGEATEAQIAQWKRQYGNVYAIEVSVDDDNESKAVGYFVKPDIKTLSSSSRYLETDPFKAGEVIFENCYIGGSELFKTDDEVKLAAITKLGELFKLRAAEIKKL